MRCYIWLCALLAAASPAAAAHAAKTSFILVGQNFSATTPAGYCLPNEATASVAKTMTAAGEAILVVDQIYFPCDLKAGQAAGRYEVIATPKVTLTMAVPTRTALLAQFKTAIADGSLAAAIHAADPLAQANKSVKDALGVDLKLEGQPKFIETDDKAAYILGLITGHLGEQEQKITMVGAMTVVKGRVFTWYVYDHDQSAATIAVMLREAKTNIARFIADNGG